MRVTAVIPVKGLDSVKTRLSQHLPPSLRRRYVVKWFLKTGSLCSQLGLQVVTITPDKHLSRLSMSKGWKVFKDSGEGLNKALKKYFDKHGKRPAMIILPDLPLLRRSDVEMVLRLASGRYSVICPDIKLDGTNILLLKAPRLFTPMYGRGSFSNHLAQLRWVKIYISSGTTHDVDSPADLSLLPPLPPKPSKDQQRCHKY